MPDARTHDIITVVSGVALAPLAYTAQMQYGGDSSRILACTALLVGAHMLSGIMFSPDLDLDSKIDDRWGIFFWIWRPYMWLVPHRHRWLSHGLAVSQILRLIYFYVVVSLALLGATWALSKVDIISPYNQRWLATQTLTVVRTYPRESLAFILGFCTGGAAHTIADWLVTGGKRYLHALGIRPRQSYRYHDRWSDRTSRHTSRSWGH